MGPMALCLQRAKRRSQTWYIDVNWTNVLFNVHDRADFDLYLGQSGVIRVINLSFQELMRLADLPYPAHSS